MQAGVRLDPFEQPGAVCRQRWGRRPPAPNQDGRSAQVSSWPGQRGMSLGVVGREPLPTGQG